MKQKHDLEELRRLQTETAAKVILEDRFKKPIEIVTGFDLAFFEDEAVAAAVTISRFNNATKVMGANVA